MSRHTAVSIGSVLALIAGSAGVLALAGPLDPPAGGVASTYKTLTEVEPRTIINQANTPGDADSVFRITQPGSYYLAGNMAGAVGKAGIEIACSDVTIDLNGFQMLGGAGSKWGVVASSQYSAITVRNGTIRGFGSSGVTGSPTHSRVQDVTVAECGDFGINLGIGGIVENCIVRDHGTTGIIVAGLGRITNCVATGGFSGIVAATQTTVSGCQTYGNQGVGITLDGGAIATNCTSYLNESHGFELDENSRLESSVSRNNEGDGVRVGFACVVSSVNADNNVGSGFRVMESGARVDSCQAVSNIGRGFQVDAPDCLVVRNSTRANAAGAYLAPAGAEYGQIIVSPGGGFVATNPWANFAF